MSRVHVVTKGLDRQTEKRAGLIKLLLDIGFVNKPSPDRFYWHHIEFQLLDFNGRCRLLSGGDDPVNFTSRIKDETILKQIMVYVDKIKSDMETFEAVCMDVQHKLNEIGVYTVQHSKSYGTRPKNSGRQSKKTDPWSAHFALKINGDRLFRMSFDDQGVFPDEGQIELDYGSDYVVVKTADDVIKFLQETQPDVRGIATVNKNSICSFSSYRLFLPYIFKYGVTSIKKISCEVVQSSDDHVVGRLIAAEKVSREYFRINLRNKMLLEDQVAVESVGRPAPENPEDVKITTVKELANLISIKPAEILKYLFKTGKPATVNQPVSLVEAKAIADSFGRGFSMGKLGELV